MATITAATNPTYGTADADTITGQGNDIVIYAGAGDDLVDWKGGDGVLYGEAGDDRLYANNLDAGTTIDGGPGDDLISAAPIGSTGFFVHVKATYVSATSGVRVDLNVTGPQEIGGGQGRDTLVSVEDLTGTPFDDVLIGDNRANSLTDGAGNDLLDGGAGNDFLFNSAGNDTLIGGAGFDVVRLGFAGAGGFTATGGVTVDLTMVGPNLTGGGFGSDTLIGIEHIVGTDFADVMIGDDGANTFAAMNGADSLYGGGGNDDLSGGPGSNYLRGGTGADTLSGGDGFDDMLGNQGNDFLIGGGGNDWVVGGQDNDRLQGDTGDDIVYGNRGADLGYGGFGNDTVRGGQDNDTLYGENGDDIIAGDRGDDTLSGGSGGDVFVTFGAADRDLVTDFNRAEGDRVRVEDGAAYTVAQEGANTVIHVTGGATMTLAGVSLASLSGDWIGVS